jgi:hypothetical protein
MRRGFNEEFFDNYTVKLPNRRRMGYTPRNIRKESDLVRMGVDFIQINGGRQRPADLHRRNHAVLLHPDFIQNYVGGSKPLAAMSREECRGVVSSWFFSRVGLGGAGVGFITSGAQEGRYANDPWAQDYTKCPQQYVWIEEMFAEVCAANDCIYIGPYDGVIEIRPGGVDGKYTAADVRQAMTSPAAAHAFMVKNESAYYPFFKERLHRYKPVVMNQYFRGSDNAHERGGELIITFIIVALALQHVGVDPASGCPFFFLGKTEFAGYTTRFVRLLEMGGILISYDFPTYSQDFQLHICIDSFRSFLYPFNWEDTAGFGKSTNIVPNDVRREGDNFLLIHTEGYNGQKAPIQVSPFDPNVVYPCLHSPASALDMYGLAAKWYEKEWAHVPSDLVPLAFTKPDGNYLDVSATFMHDCFSLNLPYVKGAESGNNYVISITDYVNVLASTNTINCRFPSGRVVPVTYVTGGPESIVGTFN